jgi:hypothetical protein
VGFYCSIFWSPYLGSVGACEKNDCDPDDVGDGDLGRIWRVGLEHKLVATLGDWSDVNCVQNL